MKAVERKQRKVRLARTDRLKANTAFKRERAVFIAAGKKSMQMVCQCTRYIDLVSRARCIENYV